MMQKNDYNALCDSIKEEFSDFEIKNKSDSRLMKAIDVFMKVVTFGLMKNFMTGFVTTLGNKVYVPDNWHLQVDRIKLIVLRRERVHMRQSKKYGRLLYSVMYLFLPVPFVFAYFRKKFEQEAYEESMRAIAEYYELNALFTEQVRPSMINHFVSAEYLWMWPWRSSVTEWYCNTAKKISDEMVQKTVVDVSQPPSD